MNIYYCNENSHKFYVDNCGILFGLKFPWFFSVLSIPYLSVPFVWPYLACLILSDLGTSRVTTYKSQQTKTLLCTSRVFTIQLYIEAASLLKLHSKAAAGPRLMWPVLVAIDLLLKTKLQGLDEKSPDRYVKIEFTLCWRFWMFLLYEMDFCYELLSLAFSANIILGHFARNHVQTQCPFTKWFQHVQNFGFPGWWLMESNRSGSSTNVCTWPDPRPALNLPIFSYLRKAPGMSQRDPSSRSPSHPDKGKVPSNTMRKCLLSGKYERKSSTNIICKNHFGTQNNYSSLSIFPLCMFQAPHGTRMTP